MAGAPGLGIAFVGSLTLCCMCIQWLGLIDHHGWRKGLVKARKESAGRYNDRRAVVGVIVRQRVQVRGKTLNELKADLPDIPQERIERALRGLSKGLLPLLTVNEGEQASAQIVLNQRHEGAGGHRPRTASTSQHVVYYTLRSTPKLRAKILTYAPSIYRLPRTAVAVIFDGVGEFSDYFYRLFDMCVALSIFVMISVLSLLPLHEAQSLLLFNANFARVIQRGTRTRDFLESIHA